MIAGHDGHRVVSQHLNASDASGIDDDAQHGGVLPDLEVTSLAYRVDVGE